MIFRQSGEGSVPLTNTFRRQCLLTHQFAYMLNFAFPFPFPHVEAAFRGSVFCFNRRHASPAPNSFLTPPRLFQTVALTYK
jgi:hypothetical protein